MHAVENAIEDHALTNGQLTHQNVRNILQDHQQEVNQSLATTTNHLNSKIDYLIGAMRGNDRRGGADEVGVSTFVNFGGDNPTNTNIRRTLHPCEGKFWHVHKCFKFPKEVRRRRGWELWLVGLPNYKKENGELAPIMPFRRF